MSVRSLSGKKSERDFPAISLAVFFSVISLKPRDSKDDINLVA